MKGKIINYNCQEILDYYIFDSNGIEKQLSISLPEKQKAKGNTYKDEAFYEYLRKYQHLIGEKGEQFILEEECKKLKDTEYLNKIEHISKSDSSAGYDILSYDKNGNKIYIEVKTTETNIDCFYLTQNEYEQAQTLKKEGEKYLIYRVINILKNPSYYIIDELSDDYSLEPLVWKVMKNKS